MPIERFKDVTIGGNEYRIGRIPALQGDWIVRNMTVGVGSMSQETYSRIQFACLEVVSVYKQGKDGAKDPMKIFGAGQWRVADLELEYNLELIYQICEAVMAFNFDDFFQKRAEEIQAKLRALNGSALSSAEPLPLTSSTQ